MISAARRDWLRGFAHRPAPNRPPWAIEEVLFVETCTRCDACIAGCPTRALARGDGGFPEFHPHTDGCTFCGECAKACEPRALVRAGTARPWMQVAAVTDRCLTRQGVLCASCADACEAKALRMQPAPGGVSHPRIDRDACTGCGACVPSCPVGAIGIVRTEVEWKLPAL